MEPKVSNKYVLAMKFLLLLVNQTKKKSKYSILFLLTDFKKLLLCGDGTGKDYQ